MFETVATYRRQAESVEADLMTRTTDLATLIDPPFRLPNVGGSADCWMRQKGHAGSFTASGPPR